MRLFGKNAIITGAGSGFGKGIAKKFTEEGANLILGDIDSQKVKEVAAEFDQNWYQVDVSKNESMKAFSEYAIKKHKDIHIVVNNAGITHHPMPWRI